MERGGGRGLPGTHLHFDIATGSCAITQAVYDLLASSEQARRRDLKVHCGGPNGVWVEDLSTRLVTTAEEVVALLRVAGNNRVTASTRMNERSSRGHLVMTVTLQQCRADGS